jgi:hypothetical protein
MVHAKLCQPKKWLSEWILLNQRPSYPKSIWIESE